MRASLEFFLGLLEDDRPCVAWEDFADRHGPALQAWQALGWLDTAPVLNPVPSCPHCGEGVPYRLGARHLCAACCSTVDSRHLLLWQLDREAFLRWLAEQLHLRGGVRRLEDRLWQLGTWENEGEILECFYRRPGPLTDTGSARLAIYRRVLVLYGLGPPVDAGPAAARRLSLLELVRLGDTPAALDLRSLLGTEGVVRLDPNSGVLWVGGAAVGEVPTQSKEFALLSCLASQLGQVVSYQDLKRAVVRQTGSTDTADEASFCQDLKRRLKKRIPNIDRLIVATNKGEGYRLRDCVVW